MMVKPTLPDDYTPFETLHFVSNVLENVSIPILIQNRPVILVGAGKEYPRIWLSIPNTRKRDHWIDVVADNEVVTPVIPDANLAPVKVVQSLEPVPTVEVWIANYPMMRVRKEDALVARVDFLELRPLGINVSGSGGGLSVGGTILSHNHIKKGTLVSAG